MSKKYDYYSASIARDLIHRIDDLFNKYPDVAKEYRTVVNPGYVKFIEDAVRQLIQKKEEWELEKIRVQNIKSNKK